MPGQDRAAWEVVWESTFYRMPKGIKKLLGFMEMSRYKPMGKVTERNEWDNLKTLH